MPYDSGNPAPFENYVVNGDMSIVQYDDAAFVAWNAFRHAGVDCWFMNGGNNACQGSIGKLADHPLLGLGGNTLILSATVGDAAIAAGDFLYVATDIEGYNAARFFSTDPAFAPFIPFSVQFWAGTTRPDTTLTMVLTDSGGALTYSVPFTMRGGTPLELEFFNLPITDAGFLAAQPFGTFNRTNGIGLEIRFYTRAGANIRGVSGDMNIWKTGAVRVGPNQSNLFTGNLGDPGMIFGLTDVQVNTSTLLPRAFHRNSFQIEYQKAQRYYWQTFPYGTVPASNSGILDGLLSYYVTVAGGNQNGLFVKHPVPMRVPAVFTGYNPSAAGANWRNITAGANSGGSAAIANGEQSVLIRSPQAGGDVIADRLAVHGTFDARFTGTP